MTLKQEEVLKRLPSNHFNLSQTMREVGYSQSSSRSGRMYAMLRAKVLKAYDPEQVKADILKAEKDFAKAGDNSNRSRMLELRAKACGITKEQSTAQVSIFQALKQDIAQLETGKTAEPEPKTIVDSPGQGNG